MGRLGGVTILILVLVVMFFRQAIGLYVDWLWFQDVGYSQLFGTILTYKFALGACCRHASRVAHLRQFEDRLVDIGRISLLQRGKHYRAAATGTDRSNCQAAAPARRPARRPDGRTPGGGQLGTTIAVSQFGIVQSARSPVRPRCWFLCVCFALAADLYHWAIFAIGVTAVASAAVYLVYRGIEYTARGLFLGERARSHLLILLGLFLLIKACGYYLDAFDLLHTPRGVSFGASYADIYGTLPALRVLTFLALIAAALCFAQIARTGYKFVFLGVGALVAVHLLGFNAYPALLQRFRVTPNEIEAERPFIERTIKFTRLAFGLDKIETKEFPADEQLTAADLKRNESTINNIRLWDHRPLLTSYAQLQEIRPYYKFVDVDNDRYIIDGTFRQVMLSARELSHRHLQSQNWINEHLTFTHGHGVVFGPVNQVTSSGQPEFFIKDIPPVSTTSLKITRPEIYYGELANEYVLVADQISGTGLSLRRSEYIHHVPGQRRRGDRQLLAQVDFRGAPRVDANLVIAGSHRRKPDPFPSEDPGAGKETRAVC